MTQHWWRLVLISTWITIGISDPTPARSPTRTNHTRSESNPRSTLYRPIPLPVDGEVKDTLSDRDIPNGDGGFSRDYSVQYHAGDQIAIDLTSDSFDTVLIFLNAAGKTISKNDDGSDGSSNSLLFVRIRDTGKYIIRVQGFGETSSGDFTLKVTKLKPQ